MDINIEFRNPAQEDFFNLTERNQCFSGGFCNGKTYSGCLKSFLLLSTFPKYRMVFARQTMKDLRETTYQTFFKICPPEFVKSDDKISGKTTLRNGATILWMHLDSFDEKSLRGLEIDSALLDQCEEIAESVYLILDSRIGRWDKAEVPPDYLNQNPNWPTNKYGRPKVPTYMMPLVNPDSQFHYIYRRYHPDSPDRLPNHVMVQAGTDPNLSDPETYAQMMSRDEEWIRRYVKGEWGISEAQIHCLSSDSILEPAPELLSRIQTKGNLFRILDHGDSSPTCCLWATVLDGSIIFYREYYLPGAVISTHRQNIYDLSRDETYSANYADPAIFKKNQQKEGAFWTTADEYITRDIEAPPIVWMPADNNEFATRNRINELLKKSPAKKHPITGVSPAPSLYFIKRTREYSQGCQYAISELTAQRRVKLGEINGKTLYSDERQEGISDHAYDCVRYLVAAHGRSRLEHMAPPPKRSFAAYLKRMKDARRLLRAIA